MSMCVHMCVQEVLARPVPGAHPQSAISTCPHGPASLARRTEEGTPQAPRAGSSGSHSLLRPRSQPERAGIR